jgi:aromatic-L-amino-acid decarboxylase
MSDFVRPPTGDLSPAELQVSLHRVAEWAFHYRTTLEARAIGPSTQPGDIAARFPDTMPAAGVPMSTVFDELDDVVMPGILHWGHPSFLGYYGSTSNGPALIGEIAAAALNVSAMTWKTSPAATELESVVMRWILDLLDFPRTFFGVVYDTASVALLHALAAARELAIPAVRARGLLHREGAPVLRVYASEQAHSSLVKAMIMLGLGENNIVRIPTDDVFRMDVDALRAAMIRDRALGFQAMAVVATIGTTSTASVDSVSAIAPVAQEFGAWLHVDAAYGGAIAALPEHRSVTEGLAAADSVVVNPHKWLFVPLDFSVLYLRNPDTLRALFLETPEYLEGDAQRSNETTPDYMDYGIQLGRRFRALKAWMVFRAFGRDGLVSRIREQRRLAEDFAEWVTATDGFELAAPLSMAVVCFRFRPPGASIDVVNAANVAIVQRINAAGGAYLTHTTLRGEVCMRIGIGNMATTTEHLVHLWTQVLEASRDLDVPM